MSKANSSSWKNTPFIEGISLDYHPAFSTDQFNKLILGLVPQQMEDKWFIFYEEPFLYFHRSWTGDPVYKVCLKNKQNSVQVTEALWEKKYSEQKDADPLYQAALLDFIVSNLLLGMNKPFPMPNKVQQSQAGVYQHHVAGTGYKEISTSKPWWKFW